MATKTGKVTEVWQELWKQNRDNKITLGRMPAAILSELVEKCGDFRGKKVMEAGCGSGVISAEIASRGADVFLLDISEDALQIARNHFDHNKLRATFILGDIFDLPLDDSRFDIVWNAGVLEHFEDEHRLKAVQGIAKLMKPEGVFISFNPSDKAFFYKIGKKAAERKGKWPYGPEFPVRSLRGECETARLTVLEEYHICFKDNLSYLFYVSKILKSIVKIMLLPFPDDFLIKKFGGYLLVTVAVKQ
jgi:2-polyprenyl-3-methyl-5-hydroxy-6-metoxy-1,4-benzoquinol methylase